MLTDVFVVLLSVAAGGVALMLGLALAVGLHSRGSGSRAPDLDRDAADSHAGDTHLDDQDGATAHADLPDRHLPAQRHAPHRDPTQRHTPLRDSAHSDTAQRRAPHRDPAQHRDAAQRHPPQRDPAQRRDLGRPQVGGGRPGGADPHGHGAHDGEPRLWTAPPLDPSAIAAQADELAAHADRAAQRAERAAAAVETGRQEYAEAEERRAAIEADYDAAQAAYAEALRVVQAGRSRPQTAEEQHRAHEVSSAALAAYRRGELSVDQLRAVFARAGDWDPAQEAREREAERLAAYEGSVRRAYDIALAVARVASERLHVAEVAAVATTQEAVDAAIEAQVAADEADRYRRRRR
jgi:hypothetical protein